MTDVLNLCEVPSIVTDDADACREFLDRIGVFVNHALAARTLAGSGTLFTRLYIEVPTRDQLALLKLSGMRIEEVRWSRSR